MKFKKTNFKMNFVNYSQKKDLFKTTVLKLRMCVLLLFVIICVLDMVRCIQIVWTHTSIVLVTVDTRLHVHIWTVPCVSTIHTIAYIEICTHIQRWTSDNHTVFVCTRATQTSAVAYCTPCKSRRQLNSNRTEVYVSTKCQLKRFGIIIYSELPSLASGRTNFIENGGYIQREREREIEIERERAQQ